MGTDEVGLDGDERHGDDTPADQRSDQARSESDAAIEASRPSSAEWLWVAAITGLAMVLRLWDIGELPSGLHGDEAITGMESWRIQDSGWIGVYTDSALGQPTLMYYPLALVQKAAGDGITVLRGFATVGGLASLLMTWWAGRRWFGVTAGLAAMAILAVMAWSVHYSRIAFSLAWWPFVGMASVYLLQRAMATNTYWRWAMAGAMAAIGVYVYNAHWVFGAALAIIVGWWGISYRDELATRWRGLAIFVLTGLVVLVPMVLYVLDDDNNYSRHIDTVGIRATPEWQSSSGGEQVRLILTAYGGAWRAMITSPTIDIVDAAGVIKPIGAPIVILALIGLIMAVVLRRRRSVVSMLLVCLLVSPFAPAMTQVSHGWLRREYVVAPIFAIFAGVALAGLHRLLSRRVSGAIASATIALIVVAIGATTANGYFSTFRNDPKQKAIFVAELTEPAAVMNGYGSDVFVNFYSPRHSINYETLRYLAPSTVGVDRSAEFGAMTGWTPVPDRGRPQLYVLIAGYANGLEELRATVPGSVVAEGVSGGVPYVAYLADS